MLDPHPRLVDAPVGLVERQVPVDVGSDDEPVGLDVSGSGRRDGSGTFCAYH